MTQGKVIPNQSPGTQSEREDMNDQMQTASAVDPWMQVEDACATALSLSQQVRHHVDEGVDADDLVPLLHQQRDAVTELQSALGSLVALPHPGQTQRRDQLGKQLRELLQLHDTSVDCLSSRGVRLSGLQRRIR